MNIKNFTLDTELEIKALTEEGEFEGYASVFNVVDTDRDVIEQGAFAKSLKNKKPSKIKMLWQHNRQNPIGEWLEMEEDSKGLWVKGQFILEVQQAREAHALMKRKQIDSLSVGFMMGQKDFEYDEKKRTRNIKNLDLWEISPVTFPANASAKISRVKSSHWTESGDLNIKQLFDDCETKRDYEQIFRDVGFSQKEAKALTSTIAPLRDVEGDEILNALKQFNYSFTK